MIRHINFFINIDNSDNRAQQIVSIVFTEFITRGGWIHDILISYLFSQEIIFSKILQNLQNIFLVEVLNLSRMNNFKPILSHHAEELNKQKTNSIQFLSKNISSKKNLTS